jgi:hypothetical protein
MAEAFCSRVQEGGADGGDEPEMRRALRQRRVQATHERMMRQVRDLCSTFRWAG